MNDNIRGIKVMGEICHINAEGIVVNHISIKEDENMNSYGLYKVVIIDRKKKEIIFNDEIILKEESTDKIRMKLVNRFELTDENIDEYSIYIYIVERFTSIEEKDG